MNKGLQALKRLQGENRVGVYDETDIAQDLEIAEYYLQALEIIKEKRIDVATLLDCHNVEEYNRWVDIRSHYSYQPLKLTQEEYDLLKEVLS